ncbi:MAG TPA: macro domain-containing protein, partial [Pyrinomonadaceae bacterium]|nr:macro domain-containing protein [Pyrinomonadaceae bacterium]
MTQSFLAGRVVVVVDDLTRQDVGAIVNAANSSLLGGGGVDGAIHDAGGPQILKECQDIRRTRYPDGLPTGEAVITSGGQLPARFVIHTVGPIYGHDPKREAELLASCYRNSLKLAVDHAVST